MKHVNWIRLAGGKSDMLNEEQVKIREQIVAEYETELEKLERYLPWLEQKTAKDQQKYYEGDENHSVIPVPVYDSTLLAFIKEAKKTKFMNMNYPYIYRRYRLKTAEDERKAIANAKIQNMDLLGGILSRYVMQGQTKGRVWTDGLTERIYVDIILKMNKLFYDHSDNTEKLIRK